MNFGIEKKTAVVHGGGGGLGGAIASALAREGARVVVADINEEAAEITAQAIRKDGGHALALRWDLADLSSIEERIKTVESQSGEVDILVNITGGPPPTPASGQSHASWTNYFSSMVLPVIAITDRVLPAMKRRRWGRIITSTSSGVVAPIPNLGISNSLRLTLVGWSKTLAREVARDGITANIVVPGRIATSRIRALDVAKAKREERQVENVEAESTESIPLGRYGRPEEYANVVAFLASEQTSYITGSVIRVDGGLIATV
jgi:3-oxoacyl-[acyl-carrier protein] reductase